MSDREFYVAAEEGIQALARALRVQIEQDRKLSVVVRDWDAKGAPRDHRRYRAIVAHVAEQVQLSGKRMSRTTWHQFFKEKFLHPVDRPGMLPAIPSIGELQRKALREFVNEVEAYAATELGVALPYREEIGP